MPQHGINAIVRNPAAIPAEPVKKPRVSRKLRSAIRLLTNGEVKTQKAAAEQVGLSPNHLCSQLNRPEIRAFIAQEARRTISTASMRASARVVELLDAESEHVSLDASRFVLGVEGIRAADETANGNTLIQNIGYVINLSSEAGPQIDHLGNNEPKPLIEQAAVRREP